MPAHNHGETQISREGDRIKVPMDITRFCILVTMIIDKDEDRNGSDDENGINGKRRYEIPLSSIKSPVMARIVRYLEYYKEEPSEFAM